MSGFRGVMKDGWHPKGKDGNKESWRGDFKGINQVAGWVGKGKDSSAKLEADHVSRPLSSLRDPSSFGPPPKRVGSGSPGSLTASNSNSATVPKLAQRPGLGAPLAPEETPRRPQSDEEEDNSAPPPPALPYRANRTGLKTDNLPPPPVRRVDSPIDSPIALQSRPGPNLPPRLPSRNAASNTPSPPPPPYSETESAIQMNQGSVARLQNAGVSVPALGIGRMDSNQSVTAQRGLNNQVNELQAHFAKKNTPGSRGSNEGVSTAASSVEQLPPSRSGYEPHNTDNNYSAASRTNSRSSLPPPATTNFRQRSNEHIETGKQKLAAFNQKHRITERIHSYFEERPAEPSPPQRSGAPPPPPPHPNLGRQDSNIDMEALNRRKAPPPPPPAKKPGLKSTPVNSNTGSSNGSSPPPLPLGTKPR